MGDSSNESDNDRLETNSCLPVTIINDKDDANNDGIYDNRKLSDLLTYWNVKQSCD